MQEVIDHEVTIDGVAAYQADLIKLDFIKENFDRMRSASQQSLDAHPQEPSLTIIQRMVDSYVFRMRHVLRAPSVRRFDVGAAIVKVKYLNDDESELEDEKDLFREMLRFSVRGHYVGIGDRAWGLFNSLPIDYIPEPWEPLLLDAAVTGAPVGSTVVLAAAALEVFITHIINRLAVDQVKPVTLWQWVTNREGKDHYLKEPSVIEQFDKLLSVFTGHSLKRDENDLWRRFDNIRKARNNFVHRGVPAVDAKASTMITEEQAKELVQGAWLIISKIRGWVPEQLRWFQPEPQIRIQWSRPLFTADLGERSKSQQHGN